MGSSGSSGGGIAAVCCLFNPHRSVQRLRNYRRFRALIARSGIRLLTVELAFGDSAFELPDGRDTLRLRGGDVMWQKERLLQIGGERLIGEGCEQLVFLDADVIFQRDDWPSLVSRALERAPVVQCFSFAVRNYDDTSRRQVSPVKTFLETGKSPRGANGIAWAMTSAAFSRAGIYQHCVVGGGDTALCCAALGLAHAEDAWERSLRHLSFIAHAGPAMLAHYRAWASAFHQATGGGVGFVDQAVIALSCGTLAGRAYHQRHHLLKGFEPDREIAVGTSGAFIWTSAGASRAPGVRQYLSSREPGDDRD